MCLGLVISENKLYEAPKKCIPCLGINVNIKTGIISIPEGKLSEIVALCLEWGTRGESNKKALQSLVGSLLVCKIPFVFFLIIFSKKTPDICL